METSRRIRLAILFGGVPFFFGAVFVGTGLYLYWSSTRALDDRPRVACRELIVRGQQAPAKIIVTEFEIDFNNAAVMQGNDRNAPDRAWIRLRPVGEAGDDASPYVILISLQATSPEQWKELAASGEVYARVRLASGSFAPRDREFLQSEFSRTIDECVFLDHERDDSPPPPRYGVACAGVGGGFLLVSVLLALLGIRLFGRPYRATDFHSEPAPVDADEPVPAELVGGVDDRHTEFHASTEIVLLEDADPGDMVWYYVTFTNRIVTQKGIAVLRPGYVAFLPTAAAQNLLVQGVEGIASGLGFVSFRPLVELFRSPSRIDELLLQLWRQDPSGFDVSLRDAAQRFGGFVWQRDEVDFRRSLRTRRKHSILFTHGRLSLWGTLTTSPVLDRLLDGWTQRPVRHIAMGVVAGVFAMVPTAVAILLFVISARTGESPGRIHGAVDVATVLDRQQVRVGDMVKVSGRPDVDSIRSVDTESGDGGLLFVLESSPDLVLVCPNSHGFGRAMRGMQKDHDVAVDLQEEWTFAGRIYDSTDTRGSGCDGTELWNFVMRNGGRGNASEVRFLAVGQRPRWGYLWPPIHVWIVGGFAALFWLSIPPMVLRMKRLDLYWRDAAASFH